MPEWITHFGEYLVRGLAVFGAALLGFWTGGGGSWAACKLARKERPNWLKKPAQWLSSLGAAILAALLLFGQGLGLGFGGGPGGGDGKTPATGKYAELKPSDLVAITAKAEPIKRADAPPPSAGRVQLTLLPGPIKEQRFYRIEPDKLPLMLKDVQKTLLDRKAAGGSSPLGVIELLKYNNSPHDERPVQLLKRWASDVGLSVSEIEVDRDVP